MVSPTTRSNLLWGVVGGLLFLVLIQGYELLAEPSISVAVKAVVAAVVGVTTATTARVLRPRLPTGRNEA